jgi:tetratricopeptide (TPR) repeat protein
MQRLIESQRAAIADFLDQRDKGVLVIRAAGEQIGYAIQILKSIEDGGSPDVFLAFAQEFVSPGQFVSLVAERVRASELRVREELGDKAAAVPSMPVVCQDESQEPETRLRATLEYARSLLPPNTGQRIVCAFLPMTIADPAGYGGLMTGLIAPGTVPPWYHLIRFILREDTLAPALGARILTIPFVTVQEFDFSPEAIAASLKEIARDGADREQRAQALLQLAFLDYAHGRADEALAGFHEVLGYYQETGNATMLAVALTGVGDVYQRGGDLGQAKDWYARAIAPAVECKSPIALFTVARNLGHVSFALRQFEEAESFFDSAQILGLQIYDPESKILALEWKALAAQQLSAPDRAIQSLTEALASARQFHKTEHEKRVQDRLRQFGVFH